MRTVETTGPVSASSFHRARRFCWLTTKTTRLQPSIWMTGSLHYWRNEHEPWTLFRAELLDLRDELVADAGFPGLVDRAPDSVLYSPGVTTRFAAPAR